MWAVVPRAAKKWAHNRGSSKADWATRRPSRGLRKYSPGYGPGGKRAVEPRRSDRPSKRAPVPKRKTATKATPAKRKTAAKKAAATKRRKKR